MSGPAPIAPVPDGVPRPRWSVMVPTYNCADTLAETLAGVLAQAPDPAAMQIEVVDDRSTRDDPEAVVAAVGRGRVGFHRQPVNRGHVGNFNTCLQRARGELVHLLHGDDLVREGFYAAMDAAFAREPALGAAFCRNAYVTEAGAEQALAPVLAATPGVLDGWTEQLAIGQRLQPPAIAVPRASYERLGGFDDRFRHFGEDWEMWLRIAAHAPVWYEPRALAAYRLREGSLTSGALRSGADIRECAMVVDIARGYLPEPLWSRVAPRAREACALGGLRRNERRLAAHGPAAISAWAVARAALGCSRSPAVVRGCARLLARAARAHARALPSPDQ